MYTSVHRKSYRKYSNCRFFYFNKYINFLEDSIVCLPKKRSHIEVLSSNVRNYRIDWGDGYLGLNRQDHLYSQTGIYDVTLM